MRHYFLLILTIILATPPPAIANDNVINWYFANFPPGIISNGPMAGQGYHDILQEKINKSLTDYKHIYHSANFSRILKQIRMENSCCICLVKNEEREKYIYFSQPTMTGVMNGVHILTKRLKDFKPYMDAEGVISLNKLFYESQMCMGISKGRVYSGIVDKIIKDNPKSDKIVTYYKKDVFAGLIKILQAEHSIDYVIGFPQEINWLQLQGKVKDEFTFIMIKEMPRYIISHIGCSKNDWGKKVISRINRILGGKYMDAYKKRYQKFLPPEAVKMHTATISHVFPVNLKEEPLTLYKKKEPDSTSLRP